MKHLALLAAACVLISGDSRSLRGEDPASERSRHAEALELVLEQGAAKLRTLEVEHAALAGAEHLFGVTRLETPAVEGTMPRFLVTYRIGERELAWWQADLATGEVRELAQPEPLAGSELRDRLGVEFAVLESKIRRSIIPTRTHYGFKIRSVAKGSPAERAGWRRGDILLEWNREPIHTIEGLRDAVRGSSEDVASAFRLARRKQGAPPWSRSPWEEIDGTVSLK